MLILRLQTPEDQEFSYTQLGGNAASSEWAQGDWTQATALAAGQPVTLLIPSSEVLLTRIVLAIGNARQLRQALPYALEENLVGELEDQHFVWQAAGNDTLDVAVIRRERLKQWMATLRQHKLRAKAILPDVFALAWAESIPTVLQLDGQAWVRTGACSGFSCPAAVTPLLLESTWEADQEHKVSLYSNELSSWTAPWQVEPYHQPNQLLQRSLQDGMALNLLNGYQDDSMSGFTRNWKRWRAAVVASVLAGLVAAGLQGMETYQLHQQWKVAEQGNLRLFREVFPDIKDITAQDVRSRVKSELKRLEAATGTTRTKASLLPYMSVIAKIFQQEGVLKITEIRSREGKLSIVFEAPDLQALDRLGQGLTAAMGKEVEIKSTQTNNKVRGELTLEVEA